MDGVDFTIVKEPDEIPMEKKQELPGNGVLNPFVKDERYIQNLISSLSEGEGADFRVFLRI